MFEQDRGLVRLQQRVISGGNIVACLLAAVYPSMPANKRLITYNCAALRPFNTWTRLHHSNLPLDRQGAAVIHTGLPSFDRVHSRTSII